MTASSESFAVVSQPVDCETSAEPVVISFTKPEPAVAYPMSLPNSNFVPDSCAESMLTESVLFSC